MEKYMKKQKIKFIILVVVIAIVVSTIVARCII